MRVELPWPARPLWPNARVHFMRKAAVVKKAKMDAYVLTTQAMGGSHRITATETVHVAICFRPPTRRRYDLDNALAALKGSLDGIAMALQVDDSRFRLTLERGDPVKGGMVAVQIDAVQKRET